MEKFEQLKRTLRDETKKYLKLYMPTEQQVKLNKQLKRQGVQVHRNVRRGTFHERFQNRLVEMADSYGLVGKKEHGVQSGFIDVLWKTPSGQEVVAIELDTKNNHRAIKKLMESKAKYAIWITVGTNFDIDDYNYLGEVELDRLVTEQKEIHFLVI